MADRTLGAAYDALARGDSSLLLELLPDAFEWPEPELPGYPLAGTHRGSDGVRNGVLEPLEALLDGLTITAGELIEADTHVVVSGVMSGRPPGADADWELPFAHVWALSDGEPVRLRAYFDRSRLTLAAARRELAEVADDLLDQAAEIRRQWARLGDALRAAGLDEDELGDEQGEPAGGSASARLAAVDLAHEGATREEVEGFLRDELGLDDPMPILDEVFGASASPPLDGSDVEIEATRLSRLFARRGS